MNKTNNWALALPLAFLTTLMLSGCGPKPDSDNINQNINTNSTSTNTNSQAKTDVPPLQEADIVRIFFTLINERQIPDAIAMMSEQAAGKESDKQAWGVQFNAFKSLKVVDVTESMKESWTDNLHNYKVTLDVQMKPEAAHAVIPYYGWEEGKNIRWVPLEKVGTAWKIGGIATGP